MRTTWKERLMMLLTADVDSASDGPLYRRYVKLVTDHFLPKIYTTVYTTNVYGILQRLIQLNKVPERL